MSVRFAAESLDVVAFDRRRQTARQSGNPAWLWPEVPATDWAQALAAIARVVSTILDGHPAELVADNAMATSLACYTSGVGPLLGWWAETGMLSAPAETASLLALHLEQARARAERMAERSRRIVSALCEASLPVVVLKGGHTAHSYFPAPEARPSSDLDLLIQAEREREAAAILQSAGLSKASHGPRESSWAPRGERQVPRSLWMVHADDPWSVDLHTSLDSQASAGAPLVSLDSARPFDSKETWPLDPRAQVLRQPLLLLHLAVHAAAGLHNLTLLRMAELVLVIRKDLAEGGLSWDEFRSLADRTGGLGASYPALRMAELLVPGTVPQVILEQSASAAPARVRAVVDRLEPGTAHRVDRASVSEHFMWVAGFGGWLRQLRSDLAPDAASLRKTWSIWEARAYRLLRGRISR